MRHISFLFAIIFLCIASTLNAAVLEKSWEKLFEGAPAGFSWSSGPLVVDSQGNSFVAGFYNQFNAQDLVLTKINTNGEQVFSTRVTYATDTIFMEYPKVIQRDPAGNIYVGGYAYGGASGTNFEAQAWVVKFSPAGAILWQHRRSFEFQSFEYRTPVAITSNGNSYIGYSTKQSAENWTLSIYKLDQDANIDWEIDHEGEKLDYLVAIATDSSENVAVLSHHYVAKFDAAGTNLWSEAWDDLGPRSGQQLWMDANGAVFAYLNHRVGTNPIVNHYAFRRYSPTGELSWERGSDLGVAQIFNQILDDGYGGCYMLGTHVNEGGAHSTNYIDLFHYSATGTLLWVKTLGPFDINNQGIARDGRGKVYLDHCENGVKKATRFDGVTGEQEAQGSFTGNGSTILGGGGGLIAFSGGDLYSTGGSGPYVVKFLQSPEAKADIYTATSGQAMSIAQGAGVISNDAYSGNSFASVVTPPSAGQLTLNPNGSFNYTPPAGFAGDVTFVYKLTKGTLTSANTTVTLKFHPVLSALAVNPATLVGGNSTTGTVTLNGNAPSGGTEVALTDNTSVITMNPAVVVPSGSSTATFTINTSPVPSEVFRQIFATRGAVTKTYTLKLVPANLSALSITPNTIVGGNKSVGKVELDGPASGLGKAINLTDNTSAIGVPASVTVPATKTFVTFYVETAGVAASVTRQVTATAGSVSRTANLTINSAGLSTLTASPSSVKGGTSTTGTVKLTGTAAGAGLTVALSDNTSVLGTPASVSVASGATTATFVITTSAVTSTVTRQVTATHNGLSRVVNVTLTP